MLVTSWKTPGSISTVSNGGVSWSGTLSDVLVDNSNTISTSVSSSNFSLLLYLSDFNFAIPSGFVPVQIDFKIYLRGQASDMASYDWHLRTSAGKLGSSLTNHPWPNVSTPVPDLYTTRDDLTLSAVNDSSFGIGVAVTRTTGSSNTARVRFVQARCWYTAESAGVDNYGFRTFKSTGDSSLEPYETFARLLHIEYKSFNFSGTFSLPSFDDTKGIFVVDYDMCKVSIASDTKLADNTAFNDYIGVTSHGYGLPGLLWNNTTKIMTVTPASLPSGFIDRYATYYPNYRIVFLHYR